MGEVAGSHNHHGLENNHAGGKTPDYVKWFDVRWTSFYVTIHLPFSLLHFIAGLIYGGTLFKEQSIFHFPSYILLQSSCNQGRFVGNSPSSIFPLPFYCRVDVRCAAL
ncbi:hypothetical protein SAMN04488023_11334 [Pedobacter rhizosphaerae]|uniref:Uncharacterized protein n=1 Tax=Pedobacter rhizosphaerae TaxID=390241 RepID=A0A1H9QXV3_9SPHI|nr:hypothetical protein SAMN04488023_11334 [Pedobacter rhizosphaerae]